MLFVMSLVICGNRWFLSKALTVDKDLPSDMWEDPPRAQKALRTIKYSHSATHLETQEGFTTFLAAALNVATLNASCSGFLWCRRGWQRQRTPVIDLKNLFPIYTCHSFWIVLKFHQFFSYKFLWLFTDIIGFTTPSYFCSLHPWICLTSLIYIH